MATLTNQTLCFDGKGRGLPLPANKNEAVLRSSRPPRGARPRCEPGGRRRHGGVGAVQRAERGQGAALQVRPRRGAGVRGLRGTAGPSRRSRRSRRPVSCRAAQYACAVAADALRRSGASAEALARARQLEAHLSLGRKRERGGSLTSLGLITNPGPLAEPPAETGVQLSDP